MKDEKAKDPQRGLQGEGDGGEPTSGNGTGNISTPAERDQIASLTPTSIGRGQTAHRTLGANLFTELPASAER